jgi:predicted O-linked N-acetylglucosamine transferase (SPINDLY family)
MDFIIADDVVVPSMATAWYAEEVIRLPHCYLPFDRDRSLGIAVDRRSVGLPDDAIVLCGFSSAYKISQEIFDVWLSLLDAVPNSVLWLRGGNATMEENLRGRARSRGVAADRIMFAAFAPRMDEHLARLQLADLFLDTTPYNAHTTGAEALWAGVPMISCRGRNFAGRVGASMLEAAGLPELICDNLQSYFQCALEFINSPRALADLRERVRSIRDTAPLLDTERYTRDFETALADMQRSARRC